MQTVVVTKLAALAMGGMIMLCSSVSNIIIDIEKINQSKNEIVQEELSEFLEEFQDYAQDYVKYQANESEFEVTHEDVNEFLNESVDEFAYNYENTHGWDGISDKTYNYMERQLPKHVREHINYPGSLNNKQEQIIWFYIKHNVFNDNLEWLKGGK